MGYVAVRGGRQAIEQAEDFFRRRRAGTSLPLTVRQIEEQLHLAVDRVMGEGSLYAPRVAALALKQACGDTFEASFMVRAYRTTLPRLENSERVSTKEMRVIRRISAAFKDIPGGQVLGPTPDYTLRLLDFDLIDEEADLPPVAAGVARAAGVERLPDSFPKIVDLLREEGLMAPLQEEKDRQEGIFDVTRESIVFPAPRSASLQSMARGETGGLLALAYSNMRGYGAVHPTIGELRVGFLPLLLRHPETGRIEKAGEVLATEAEVIAHMTGAGDGPQFQLGYGFCFGHNETKAISMAVLDRAMECSDPRGPSEDQEFVLLHTDGIEAMGFCNHYKLPHYVTFQSALDRIRKARKENVQPAKDVRPAESREDDRD